MKDYFSTISYFVVETNSACNLDCIYCNRRELVEAGLREAKNMTEPELHFICEQFKNCPIDTVKIEGLSEPMLHPAFDKMSGIIRTYFPKAFIIVITNCQYEMQKTPFLNTLPNVDIVYLSIDGVGETYERLRTNSRYKKLLKTLEDIKRLVPASERNKKLFINFTATDENYLEIPEMYKFKEEYGLAGVRINLAQSWTEDQLNNRSFSENFIHYLRHYKKDVKGTGNWKYNQCFWPFNGVMIDVFGFMRPCIINTTSKPYGNVFKDDVKHIFNTNAYLNDIRNKLIKNEADQHCMTCDYKFLSPLLQKIFQAPEYSNPPRKVVLPV